MMAIMGRWGNGVRSGRFGLLWGQRGLLCTWAAAAIA